MSDAAAPNTATRRRPTLAASDRGVPPAGERSAVSARSHKPVEVVRRREHRGRDAVRRTRRSGSCPVTFRVLVGVFRGSPRWCGCGCGWEWGWSGGGVLELTSDAVEAGAHRADGDGQHLGDLGVRHPLPRHQGEQIAILGVEVDDCREHPASSGRRRRVGRRCPPMGRPPRGRRLRSIVGAPPVDDARCASGAAAGSSRCRRASPGPTPARGRTAPTTRSPAGTSRRPRRRPDRARPGGWHRRGDRRRAQRTAHERRRSPPARRRRSLPHCRSRTDESVAGSLPPHPVLARCSHRIRNRTAHRSVRG